MEQHGVIRRRRLPHWDLPGATYFVTTCLDGSIPAEGLLRLSRMRIANGSPRGADETGARADAWKRLFVQCEKWLDEQPAVRFLENSELARIVADAFYFWSGRLYDLLAYVVMPSHVHWVFRPVEQVSNLPHARSPRERIMHSIKRHTARECNRLLGRMGRFWQEESYDHCVRDDGELERIIHYVEHNPVKAGLVKAAEMWANSSARDRAAAGVTVGQALTRGADS
jgi:putative transposase